MPGDDGMRTASCTVCDAPGATSAVSAVRSPSQTAARPALSYQWYATFTGFGAATFHGTLPVLTSVTGTFWDSPMYANEDPDTP